MWLNLPLDQKKFLKVRTAELHIYSTEPLTCESNIEALEDGVNECWKLGQKDRSLLINPEIPDDCSLVSLFFFSFVHLFIQVIT